MCLLHQDLKTSQWKVGGAHLQSQLLGRLRKEDHLNPGIKRSVPLLITKKKRKKTHTEKKGKRAGRFHVALGLTSSTKQNNQTPPVGIIHTQVLGYCNGRTRPFTLFPPPFFLICGDEPRATAKPALNYCTIPRLELSLCIPHTYSPQEHQDHHFLVHNVTPPPSSTTPGALT